MLARRAWGITQTGPSGFVQKQLGEGLVMIRTSVYDEDERRVRDHEDDQIVLDDSLQPVIDAVIKGAGKIHAQAKLIVSRKPELGPAGSEGDRGRHSARCIGRPDRHRRADHRRGRLARARGGGFGHPPKEESIMNDDDYSALIGRLSKSKRCVYEALRDNPPLTDVDSHGLVRGRAGEVPTRRAELARLGIVRQAGKRGASKLWTLAPPADVEAVAQNTKARLRPINEHPLDVRVNAFLALADDEEVREAIEDPERSMKRQQRKSVRTVLARNARERRERERQLREAMEQELPAVEAMRLRNAILDADDLIRALRVVLDEENERRRMIADPAVPDAEWGRVLRALEAGIRHHENAYESVARLIDAPSRNVADIELDEGDVIEDAEYELVAELGKGVRETP